MNNWDGASRGGTGELTMNLGSREILGDNVSDVGSQENAGDLPTVSAHLSCKVHLWIVLAAGEIDTYVMKSSFFRSRRGGEARERRRLSEATTFW